MWSDPLPALAPTAEPAPLPPRFVLAGEGPHALAPGLVLGPALCGEEEPDPGWALTGFTSADLDRIGCESCRPAGRTEAIGPTAPHRGRPWERWVMAEDGAGGGRQLEIGSRLRYENGRRSEVRIGGDGRPTTALDTAVDSPLATALLGRRASDLVALELAPGTELAFTIVRIA